MPIELDHVFILCDAGADASALARLGLREGSPNTHPGQGTACRRFFFANAYLELLWVSDETEAQNVELRPLQLWDRWAGRGKATCPFGIIVRPADATETAPPFQTWSYTPPYLPAGMRIDVAAGTTLDEPALFCLPSGRRPDAMGREPIAHDLPVRALTRVRIELPRATTISAAARDAASTGVVSFAASAVFLMELGFDDEPAARSADLRPQLPLRLCW
jgi:hypothetical protein